MHNSASINYRIRQGVPDINSSCKEKWVILKTSIIWPRKRLYLKVGRFQWTSLFLSGLLFSLFISIVVVALFKSGYKDLITNTVTTKIQFRPIYLQWMWSWSALSTDHLKQRCANKGTNCTVTLKRKFYTEVLIQLVLISKCLSIACLIGLKLDKFSFATASFARGHDLKIVKKHLVTGNMREKYGAVRKRGFRDMGSREQTEKQSCRHSSQYFDPPHPMK